MPSGRKWVSGRPPKESKELFWFDAGFDRARGSMPLIYKRECVNGRGTSSMPISMVYDEKSSLRARHMVIDPPASYGDFKILNHTSGESACLIKQIKNDDGAVGILFFSTAFGMHGSIVWLDHPSCSTQAGVDIDVNKYQFAVLEIPT